MSKTSSKIHSNYFQTSPKTFGICLATLPPPPYIVQNNAQNLHTKIWILDQHPSPDLFWKRLSQETSGQKLVAKIFKNKKNFSFERFKIPLYFLKYHFICPKYHCIGSKYLCMGPKYHYMCPKYCRFCHKYHLDCPKSHCICPKYYSIFTLYHCICQNTTVFVPNTTVFVPKDHCKCQIYQIYQIYPKCHYIFPRYRCICPKYHCICSKYHCICLKYHCICRKYHIDIDKYINIGIDTNIDIDINIDINIDIDNFNTDESTMNSFHTCSSFLFLYTCRSGQVS